MCTPSMPNGAPQPDYWKTGVPGMTNEEVAALPQALTGEVWGKSALDAIAERKDERDVAIEDWKKKNPERYEEGLRLERERLNPSPPPDKAQLQSARTARKGAGGGGGGSGSGPSSAGTLLTTGAPSGVDPGSLDLSKATLLGL